MKNAPIQTANEGAGDTANSTTSKFYGTDNPRHLRALNALLTRPQRREHLDAVAGCSNAPELVAELRRRGLDVPCDRVPDLDRDGLPVRRGVYSLDKNDRRKISAWLRQRDAKGRA
jgi:hypothetical protein